MAKKCHIVFSWHHTPSFTYSGIWLSRRRADIP